MRFEWDDSKALRNLLKHGISFEEAITVFDDDFGRIEEDLKHSTPNETRWLRIAESDIGIIVIVYTMREEGLVCRIISARQANRREKELYVKNKGI